VKPLCLVGIRDGKPTIRWPVLLARFCVYLAIFGGVIALATWVSDLIFKEHHLGDFGRLVSLSGFLAILFVVFDVRRDLKLPSKDLPRLGGEVRSDAE